MHANDIDVSDEQIIKRLMIKMLSWVIQLVLESIFAGFETWMNVIILPVK